MSLTITQLDATGQEAGTVTLTGPLVEEPARPHLIYQAVRRALNNARAGTANCKTRAEVRGGGRKPWRQKGTGRARAGSIRSPLWRGGGVIFGPKPRSFAFDMPKKMRKLAVLSAFSAAGNRIRLVQDFSFLTAPKTKEMANFLKTAKVQGQNILIVSDYRLPENQNLLKSARNLAKVEVRLPDQPSVQALLKADIILVSQDALAWLQQYAQFERRKAA
jgi:large subunit ribosomal protein L4